MNLDFSDRKIMAAGLVLLVVAAGLGVFWIVDESTSEIPITQTSATGSFLIEVTENIDNGEEITETETDSAG
jgi:hypothetical protein|tara:strand:- start:1149 stop:1364 length:216 start_codon:yes stop_codon:yes gene_type:complete